MALNLICTGPCTNLILDPGSSSLCYMVAGPLGGALGGSTRNWTHQRLGTLTMLGKTNQDGEVHGSLSLTPRTLLTLGGAARTHHVFRPFIRVPSKQPPTLAGDKNSLLAWLNIRLPDCALQRDVTMDKRVCVLHYAYSSTARLLGLLIRQLGLLTAMRQSDQLTLALPMHRLCRKIIRRRSILTLSASPSASVYGIFLAGDEEKRGSGFAVSKAEFDGIAIPS